MKTDTKNTDAIILRRTKFFGFEVKFQQIVASIEYNFTTDKYKMRLVVFNDDNVASYQGSLHDVVESALRDTRSDYRATVVLKANINHLIDYFYNEFQPICVENGGNVEHFELIKKRDICTYEDYIQSSNPDNSLIVIRCEFDLSRGKYISETIENHNVNEPILSDYYLTKVKKFVALRAYENIKRRLDALRLLND
jgi:hypothetical protein